MEVVEVVFRGCIQNDISALSALAYGLQVDCGVSFDTYRLEIKNGQAYFTKIILFLVCLFLSRGECKMSRAKACLYYKKN